MTRNVQTLSSLNILNAQLRGEPIGTLFELAWFSFILQLEATAYYDGSLYLGLRAFNREFCVALWLR